MALEQTSWSWFHGSRPGPGPCSSPDAWHSAISLPLIKFSPRHHDAASRVVVGEGKGCGLAINSGPVRRAKQNFRCFHSRVLQIMVFILAGGKQSLKIVAVSPSQITETGTVQRKREKRDMAKNLFSGVWMNWVTQLSRAYSILQNFSVYCYLLAVKLWPNIKICHICSVLSSGSPLPKCSKCCILWLAEEVFFFWSSLLMCHSGLLWDLYCINFLFGFSG